jgi:ribulose-5-phosphate 4-epimerase/fuculose-1-phosphate aldolase
MEIMNELIKYARKTKEAGLIVSSSGNISARLDKNRFAISSSGAYLGELGKNDICVCTLDNSGKHEGSPPSLETSFHRAIYIERQDIAAVLHFQSPCATALACTGEINFDLNFIPEVPVYIKSIKVVPYSNPGTEELSHKISEMVREPDCNVLVLQNHGQISVGKDLKTVLRNAEFFEFACRIACQGVKLKRYNKETIEKLKSYDKT